VIGSKRWAPPLTLAASPGAGLAGENPELDFVDPVVPEVPEPRLVFPDDDPLELDPEDELLDVGFAAGAPPHDPDELPDDGLPALELDAVAAARSSCNTCCRAASSAPYWA
jgi:hypothetical protein